MNSTEIKVGLIPNDVYQVQLFGNALKLVSPDGEVLGANGVTRGCRKGAFKSGNALQGYIQSNGSKVFRQVPMDVFNSLVKPLSTESGKEQTEIASDHESVKDFIHNGSIDLKPRELVMDELKWKHLVRSAVRAKNIMMTGPSGCGKTMAAKALVKALDRPDFYFNLGATQDPRATLIGNTQFSKEDGTFFSESAFVKAIKTPQAVILLDELSRAHPDAGNILMTVLDNGQRYLRLDEKAGSPIVKVAEGVTFIATANIGSEYTSTRVIDRALLDRFVTIEMRVLTDIEEFDLLKFMFPDVDDYDLKAIAEVAHHTRVQWANEDGKLTDMISTRIAVETAGLLYDGFSLLESAEISFFPFFSPDGGAESERTYVKQLIQKYDRTDIDKKLFDSKNISTDEVEDEVPIF